jgi:hypothetical protein
MERIAALEVRVAALEIALGQAVRTIGQLAETHMSGAKAFNALCESLNNLRGCVEVLNERMDDEGPSQHRTLHTVN